MKNYTLKPFTSKHRVCSICKGSGKLKIEGQTKPRKCGRCNGSGSEEPSEFSLNSFPQREADARPYCKAARAGLRQSEGLRSCRASVNSPGSALHVRFQDSPTWATPSGVAKKRKIIENKGLPDMKGRRFLTLTLDQAAFGYCPVTGYLAGKEHMRRFLEAGRLAGLWERGAWWAWKLEFQKNTWAHWHVIIDRTRKFTLDEMRKIDKIWGLGGTNCRRISKSKFGYQFKYAFKGVFQDDSDGSGLCLPQWFLDYYEQGRDGSKPVSFSRCRFWQTSKGFYTGQRLPAPKGKAPVSSLRPRPVREVLEDSNASALLIARDGRGRYRNSVRVRLAVDFAGFSKVHLWDAEHGAAATLSIRSFMCSPQSVTTKLIEKYELCKLQQVLRENKMTVRQALQLRQERKQLMTC